MAEVVLFHHSQGLTPGVLALAEDLRSGGHTVHTPELFEGHTFASIDEGMSYIQRQGFMEMIQRGVRAADDLPDDVVYAGISFGVMVAQMLAQTRPTARGAIFLESCALASEFGTWPPALPAQIHGMDADPYFALEGDIEAARELVELGDAVELFVYPGDRHLFVDSSLPSYDAEAAALVGDRVLTFLAAR